MMSAKKQGIQTIKIPGFLLNKLYEWGDGWWIGRSPHMGKMVSFVLVSEAGKAMSILRIRKYTGVVHAPPITIDGRVVTKGTSSREVEEEALATRKRWYPFLKDYLWGVDLSDFDSQEFPVFVSDDVFERAAQIDSGDLKADYDLAISSLRPIGSSEDPADRAAIDMMERVFATQTEKLPTTGISLQLQGTKFRFSWSGRTGWKANRISSVGSGEVRGHIFKAHSPSKLIAKLTEHSILLPASDEAVWGPPGQLTIDVDFSMYRMLGMPSPLLESNAVYAEWIQALETATG